MIKRSSLVVGLATVVAAGLAMGSAQAQVQNSAQTKCIVKMNNDGIKVAKAQAKEDYRCVRLERNNDEANDVDACINDDALSKVEKKTARTTKHYNKFCTADPPNFGYANDATVNAAAKDAERDLLRDMFGDPNLVDPYVYDCDPHVNECRCQQTVLRWADKLFYQVAWEFYKCKKNALRVGPNPFPLGANDPNNLVQCVNDPETLGSIISDNDERLRNRVNGLGLAITDRGCNADGLLETFGGPYCNKTVLGDPRDDTDLRDCLASRVYCRVCQMISKMDNLSIGCAALVTAATGYTTTCPDPAP